MRYYLRPIDNQWGIAKQNLVDGAWIDVEPVTLYATFGDAISQSELHSPLCYDQDDYSVPNSWRPSDQVMEEMYGGD